VICPLAEKCLPRDYEQVLAEMRLMEKIGKGGIIKLYWDGKGWKVTAIRSTKTKK
jgi:hypothetical protein